MFLATLSAHVSAALIGPGSKFAIRQFCLFDIRRFLISDRVELRHFAGALNLNGCWKLSTLFVFSSEDSKFFQLYPKSRQRERKWEGTNANSKFVGPPTARSDTALVAIATLSNISSGWPEREARVA